MGTPHRILEIPLYHYDQLSPEAQEKARNWWRECEAQDPTWLSENVQSMEAFCKHFEVEAREWEYDAWSSRISSRYVGEEDIGNLCGKRLHAHLWNKYQDLLFPKKFFRLPGEGGRKRRSKIMRESEPRASCQFTGYYMDNVLLDPLYEFLSGQKHQLCDLKNLLDDCLERWVAACQKEMAASLEDKNVVEAIEANEYEFTAEGKVQ